jgi:hypothetical protein
LPLTAGAYVCTWAGFGGRVAACGVGVTGRVPSACPLGQGWAKAGPSTPGGQFHAAEVPPADDADHRLPQCVKTKRMAQESKFDRYSKIVTIALACRWGITARGQT